MKPTKEEIAARLDRNKAILQNKPVDVWRPTITEREKEEREKLIAAGILPF